MNYKRIIPLMAVATLLVGCNNKSSSNTGDTSNTNTNTEPTTEPVPEEETFKIKVTAPGAVHYTLDKEEAKKGESVTLTINSIDDGFTITNITLNNSKELTLNTSNKVTFVMPNRSASIVIKCSVSGDVTLNGDITAVLTDSDNDGVFVAKNVKVDLSKEDAFFSYCVSGNRLSSQELDERRCYADISYSDDKSYSLTIASGSTYDFYYDTNSQYPCYVIRTSVDVLPQETSSLYSLFDGRYHSETTCNPTNAGLNHIEYSVKDLTNKDQLLWNNFEWDLYQNNKSFGLVSDIANSDKRGNPKEYYVYKEADLTNNVLTVVDTFSKSRGNNDRTRDEYNNYGQYSAKFDIVNVDDDNNSRFERYVGDATYAVRSSAHTGYEFEREFMYAYRVGFEADELTWSKCDIKSVAEEGGFKTTVSSILQYDCEEGAYTTRRHEAILYDITIHFNQAGAILELEYDQIQYKQEEWNFSTHTPLMGFDGNFQKSISYTATYGEAKSGSPDFDLAPYFVTDFTKMHFYNPDCSAAVPGGADDGVTNYIHYSDKVKINPTEATEKLNSLTLEYVPSTALDVWEYGPTTSTNENVIRKNPNDRYNEMTAVDMGTSDVTFTNHTRNTGISHTETINVVATKKYHSIYIWHQEYDTDGTNPVTSSTSANIVAGTTATFKVGVTPSDAPVIYDAAAYKEVPNVVTGYPGVVEPRMKVVSTGERLVLDCTDFADITEPCKVIVRCSSETWFVDWKVANKTPYQDLEFTVTPASVNPLGEWRCDFTGEAAGEYVDVVFSNESVNTDKLNNAKKGVLKSLCIDDAGYEYLDTFNFVWNYELGYINCIVTSVNIQSATFDTEYYKFNISFAYLSDYNTWGVAVVASEYDSDAEQWYSYIWDYIGTVDAQGDVDGYLKLTKVK